jgi:hypothetical protein
MYTILYIKLKLLFGQTKHCGCVSYLKLYVYYESWDSTVGIETVCKLGDRGTGRSSSPHKAKHFHFSISSKLFLAPTQPPIQLVWGGLFPRGWICRGVKLTTHLQLVPQLRKFRSTYVLIHPCTYFYNFIVYCVHTGGLSLESIMKKSGRKDREVGEQKLIRTAQE